MQSWIHVIEWRANVRPELTALVDDRGTAYTYAQLRAETERRAEGWAGLGLGSGDVVAVVAKNSADFLLHAFALMRAGATPAFVNWRLSPRELTEVLALVEPKAIAADAEFAGLVEAAWPEPLPRVVIGGGPVAEGWLDGAAPSGLSGVSGVSGSSVADFAIEADRIEFFTAGPSLIDMLVAEIRRRDGADLSSLREIAYGTAPITPSSLTAAVAAFGCRFRQIYGNTESQSMISLLAPEDHQPGHPRLGSAGRMSFGWEVRIVEPGGRDLGFEEAGELLIRGEPLFSGYWRDPGATAAAFAEVEAVLARHPAVADVAVLGRPDPAWGEAVHAVIIPAAGQAVPAAEIIAWCRDRLAHFKCPKSVEFTDALPRTTTGKVLKRELRALLSGPQVRS